MKLSDYLKQHNMSQRDFARQAGLPEETISRIVNGKRLPTLPQAKIIVATSKNAVTFHDFDKVSPEDGDAA